MTGWKLPQSLPVGGCDIPIRTDYRAILHILREFGNKEDEPEIKWLICLKILYKQEIPAEYVKEAMERAVDFINAGIDPGGRNAPICMDWERDEALIATAISEKLGGDVRSVPYMHWWTFIGAYMNISSHSLFSSVVSIRSKRARGKKLDKNEIEFYKQNRHLIDMHREERSEEEKEALRKLFGYKKK